MEECGKIVSTPYIEQLKPSVKLGLSLFIGFEGTHLTRQLRELIESCHIGGVVLFSRNYESPSQLRTLCLDLQEVARQNPPNIPMVICVDQEGGRVNRFAEPFTHFPSPFVLGKTSDPNLVFEVGLAAARELSAAGINTNLAPVLDLRTNRKNRVIADRSFGADPEVVSLMGNAYIKGLKTGEVLSVAKHFPGHGDTIEDSHFLVPVSDQSEELLNIRELIPFRKAILNGVDAIMTSHVLYPKVDGLHLATFSQIIIRKMLREGCSFTGSVISDDLLMGAVAKLYSLYEASLTAYNAGVDILLISRGDISGPIIHQALLKNFSEGKIREERINAATYNILKMKEKIKEPAFKTEGNILDVIGCKSHQELIRRVEEKTGVKSAHDSDRQKN